MTPLRSMNEGASVSGPTWTYEVVPSGMPHSGPDMSTRDMRLRAASEEVAGSVDTESLATDGLVLPTWQLQAGGPSYHSGIGQPALGRAELPAALGSLLARGSLCTGPVCERMLGRRTAASWLGRAV